MQGQQLLFEALVNGERDEARAVVGECLEAGLSGQQIVEQVFWPVYDVVQTMFRRDQMSDIAHRYATRLLRKLIEQNQIYMAQAPERGKRIILAGGSDEAEELAAQMTADLLEADGYEVYFMGGGVARDEIIEQVGRLRPETLIVFGSTPGDLPYLREVIDTLRETDACPSMQIVVGGGVFNRADGLAEEIGADLWAATPTELVQALDSQSERRMPAGQQTVGRKLRLRRISAA
jgi:methanogenic corrinoid protein MtbC1